MFLITWIMVLLSRLVFTTFGGCPWSRTIISPMAAVSAYLKRLSNVPFLPWVQSLRCLGPERCVFLLQQTRRSGSGKYRWNTHRIPVARTVLCSVRSDLRCYRTERCDGVGTDMVLQHQTRTCVPRPVSVFLQVFDATNTTQERREVILSFAKENGYKVCKPNWCCCLNVR